MRDAAHGVEEFLEQLAANRLLGELRGDIKAADKPFLLLQHIKRVAGSGAIFESHATGESVGVQEAFDEVERAAVIPMQLITPVPGLFFQERLNLADAGLSQVHDVHRRVEGGTVP